MTNETALREALKVADDAIREMFRYYDGGETRGSYDGKPERAQLRKAGYVVRAALQSPSQPVVAEAVEPDGWLVERLQGEGYGRPRKVIDAQQYDASSDDFWTSPEAKARHRITPLYAHPQASPPPVQSEVTITREMFDFLRGAGPLEGYHFGEANPNERGAFWWRRRLIAHSQTETQEGEV